MIFNIHLKSKRIFITTFWLIINLSGVNLSAQNMDAETINKDHFPGLEGIIVEPYYIHSGHACNDDTLETLKPGFVTYRVFVDMAPGYRLQAIFGIEGHPFMIKTSTTFYNQITLGSKAGIDIADDDLNKCNVAFDTWMTLGAASKKNMGVLKEEDTDGSILDYDALEKQDGMARSDSIQPIKYFVNDYTFNNNEGSAAYMMKDGVFAVYKGVMGLSEDNYVLISQITTDGAISLSINLQIISPEGSVIKYVAENPSGHEIQHKELNIYQLKLNDYGIHYLPSQDFSRN